MTETAAVTDYDQVSNLLQKLQKAGFQTSLDDFGAGHSVLNTTFNLPVNTVKIDRLFISNCERSEKGIYFLQHMIQLVKGVGYNVVCEGVETEKQAAIIQEAGCEEAQGYLFAPPMPIAEYEKLMYGEN